MSDPVPARCYHCNALVQWNGPVSVYQCHSCGHMDGSAKIVQRASQRTTPIENKETPSVALPSREWHEDYGPVLWWTFPIQEPPYVGSPLDDDWPFDDVASHDLYWTALRAPVKPEDRTRP